MVIAPCRRLFALGLLLAPVLFGTVGCKSGGGWAMPWSGLGWGGAAPSSNALGISKPSTRAPVTNAPGQQPARGLASGNVSDQSGVATTGGSGPAGGVAAYPATAQANAYPTSTAATWQPGAEAGGPVAPAAGYQVGPYGMQAGQTAGGQPNNSLTNPGTGAAPNSYGGRAPYAGAPQGPTNNGAAGVASPPAEGYTPETYRTATQPPARGGALGSGGLNPAETPAAAGSGSIYEETSGAATATEPSLYGPSPSSSTETSPAEAGGSQPTYGPPNTVAPPAASRPATSPTATPPRTSLPPSLSGAGGYRPGSTNFGTRNAAYDEPQNAAAPAGSPTGSTYMR